MRKVLVFSIGLLTTLVGAFPVFADTTLYSQSISNAATTGTGPSGYVQSFGTGLTGVLNEISFQYDVLASTSTVSRISAWILNCSSQPSGSSLGNCNSFVPVEIVSNIGTAGSYQAFIDTATIGGHISFDPSRYYGLWINSDLGSTGPPNVRFRGSTSNSYTNGSCSVAAGTSGNCATVLDLFFVLNGVQTATDRSLVTAVYPENASTTASTEVQIGFDYHAASANSITTYYFSLMDLTIDDDITISGTASTGDASVRRQISLTSGHTYSATAAICSSAGTCYGGPTNVFSVVSGGYNVGSTYATSSTDGRPDLSSIVIASPVDTTEDNALERFLQALNGFVNLPALISRKVPTGYLWDIGTIYLTAASSSTEFAGVSIDFGSSSLSSTTKAILPSRFEIFSTTTVTHFLPAGILSTFNALASAALWVSLMGYFFLRVKGLFS